MARRKAKRGVSRKKRAKAPRARRKAAGTGSAALAKARARIAELEAENRRLRDELGSARGGPGLAADADEAPLAPGM